MGSQRLCREGGNWGCVLCLPSESNQAALLCVNHAAWCSAAGTAPPGHLKQSKQTALGKSSSLEEYKHSEYIKLPGPHRPSPSKGPPPCLQGAVVVTGMVQESPAAAG
ncbi:unnamed protein product [Eretmochelys imbricata]